MNFINNFKFVFLFGFLFLMFGFGYSAECVSGYVLNNSCTLNSSKLYDNMNLKLIIPDKTCFKVPSDMYNDYFCEGEINLNFKYTGSLGDDLDISAKYIPKSRIRYINGEYFKIDNIMQIVNLESLNRDDLEDNASFRISLSYTTKYLSILWNNTANEKDKVGYLTIGLDNTKQILDVKTEKYGCQEYTTKNPKILFCGTLKYNFYGSELSNISLYEYINNCYKKIDAQLIASTKTITYINNSGYQQSIAFDPKINYISNPNICQGSEPIPEFTNDFENLNCETITSLPENYSCTNSISQPYLILDTTQNGFYKCNDKYYKKESPNIFICNNPSEQTNIPTTNTTSKCTTYIGDLTSKKCFDLTADFDVLDTKWTYSEGVAYYDEVPINTLATNNKYVCTENTDIIYIDLINSKVCFEQTNKTTLSATGTGTKIIPTGAGSGSGNTGTGAGAQTITCNSEPNYNCVNGWKAGSYPDIQNVSGNGIFNCNGKYYKIESGNQYYCNPTQIGFWQGFFTKLKDAFKKKVQ